MVKGEASSKGAEAEPTGDSQEHNRLIHDGQSQCMRGAYVKISQEYATWDVFKKFVGKVGIYSV
jgi:hypothetical protein